MGIVPNSRLGKIEFYEAHVGPWTANAANVGLASAAVTALSAAVTAARAAFVAHLAAQEAAKAATNNFYDKVRLMHNAPGFGADMIQTIKTYAQTKNDPNVYNLAQIPPPPTPGAVPPPGTPFDFKTTLNGDGSITLKWKCNNPEGSQGTVYEIARKVGAGGGGAFSVLGAVGTRSFVDDTIPAGSSPVTYQLTAVRGQTRGTPSQYVVNFGAGGASVTEVRLAA